MYTFSKCTIFIFTPAKHERSHRRSVALPAVGTGVILERHSNRRVAPGRLFCSETLVDTHAVEEATQRGPISLHSVPPRGSILHPIGHNHHQEIGIKTICQPYSVLMVLHALLCVCVCI